jgi:16S rRNA (cytosine967-C5)-methyltransferase
MRRAHRSTSRPRWNRREVPGAEQLPTGSLRLVRCGPGLVPARFCRGRMVGAGRRSRLPVRLLGDVRGLRVLDMCAAPGGKTLQLAAGGADVVALDLSDSRLDRLRENLARTGFPPRSSSPMRWSMSGRYDAILLDAPCTATGTIRRHPDLPFVKSRAGDRRAHAVADAPSGPRDHTARIPAARLCSAPAPFWPSKASIRSRPR